MVKQIWDSEKKLWVVQCEETGPCPVCRYPDGDHAMLCPIAPDSWRAANYHRFISTLNNKIERLEAVEKRRNDMIAMWHAKYMVVKHENNQLRKKLRNQGEPTNG